MKWYVVIELLVWLLICCVLIELPCRYWTNKKANWARNHSANFRFYTVKRKKDIHVKQHQLRKWPKQRKNNVFARSPPGFNGLKPNLECERLTPKASWNTKSGDRGVKSGVTSPHGLILKFAILRWRFPGPLSHVTFSPRRPNFRNP